MRKAVLDYLEEEGEQEEDSNGPKCYICKRTPTEWTSFICDSCGNCFWEGYLCRIDLARLMSNKVTFIAKHFPGLHSKCGN